MKRSVSVFAYSCFSRIAQNNGLPPHSSICMGGSLGQLAISQISIPVISVPSVIEKSMQEYLLKTV